MVYLDYNATTPVDAVVADAMAPYLCGNYGNPSSYHEYGVTARQAVRTARAKVAESIGCKADELVFTSGGSESNNTVLKGAAYAFREKGNHIITSSVEHPAVLEPCRYLQRNGYEVTYLPVDGYGMVDPDDVRRAITARTILVSVMHANNEVGTIQPIEDISRICREREVLLHTDAAQSVGKIPVDVHALGVDFLTVAGHKLYAPKGIGALYIRERISVEPLIHGAGHEQGRRAGTENVIFCVGLGAACEMAQSFARDSALRSLAQYFHKGLLDAFGANIRLNGHPEKRLPNTLNISFLGHTSQEIMDDLLTDLAVSAGAACHAGATTLSPVLKAMGIPEEEGMGAIRFSLGRYTTKEEIDEALEALRKVI